MENFLARLKTYLKRCEFSELLSTNSFCSKVTRFLNKKSNVLTISRMYDRILVCLFYIGKFLEETLHESKKNFNCSLCWKEYIT